jgi:hypothetical protein
MLYHFYSNIEHYLFVFILLGRIGDIGSTYLATPQLRLETNPIIRKLKWPFAIVTLLISFIAYYHAGLAVMILISTYFVCSANISKLWAIRTVGED